MTTLKHIHKKIIAVACLLWSLNTFAQDDGVKGTEGQLKLVFELKAGNETIKPGNTYTNPFGEQYTIQKCRFYISQIQLVDSLDMSIQFFPDNYYIIAAVDTTSSVITLPLSLSHISSVSFVVGIDSSANVSGVQTGALDPGNGMFWTWNTGYIMLKLMGTSPAAQVPGNAFTLDIGGYKTGENAARKIVLRTGTPHRQKVHSITISADINKLFQGAHNIKLAEHPMCHQPGELAMQLADNYAAMFSILQVNK